MNIQAVMEREMEDIYGRLVLLVLLKMMAEEER
jgi:hypothetical protein